MLTLKSHSKSLSFAIFFVWKLICVETFGVVNYCKLVILSKNFSISWTKFNWLLTHIWSALIKHSLVIHGFVESLNENDALMTLLIITWSQMQSFRINNEHCELTKFSCSCTFKYVPLQSH
jgi:hypothetical protein